MRRGSRLLALTVCLVAAGALTVQVLAGPSAGPSAAFSPKSLTGKWSGKWTNQTFGSTGSVRATVRLRSGKLKPTIQFGGNVFGCESPPAAIFSMSKGKGANRYNATGFKVARSTEAFGRVTGTYKHSNNSLTGNGKAPPCRPGITWTLTGKLTASKFTGTAKIKLETGQTATTKITAKKL
jgi:hypothetical protein